MEKGKFKVKGLKLWFGLKFMEVQKVASTLFTEKLHLQIRSITIRACDASILNRKPTSISPLNLPRQ